MLYGYYPYDVKNPGVKVEPIMSVFAPIVKNRTLPKGEHVMYGDFLTDDEVKISVIRYGYADGLPRKVVSGQVNCRCMDLTAIKNDTKNKYFRILFKNAHEIAKKYGTISYDVLTSVAKRAKRVYKR
jgi:alanine racemase